MTDNSLDFRTFFEALPGSFLLNSVRKESNALPAYKIPPVTCYNLSIQSGPPWIWIQFCLINCQPIAGQDLKIFLYFPLYFETVPKARAVARLVYNRVSIKCLVAIDC